jgi:hypothetical protein
MEACTKASVFFLISSMSSPFKASFTADDASSIVFFSASETFAPCSF